jgi:hypothetical protein
MTTLVVAQRRIWTSLNAFVRISALSMAEGYGRLISVFLFFSAVAVIVVYLVALYATFSIGFQIQEYTVQYADMAEQTLEAELALRRREIYLAEEYESLIQSMETVSAINYITLTESVAVK